MHCLKAKCVFELLLVLFLILRKASGFAGVKLTKELMSHFEIRRKLHDFRTSLLDEELRAFQEPQTQNHVFDFRDGLSLRSVHFVGFLLGPESVSCIELAGRSQGIDQGQIRGKLVEERHFRRNISHCFEFLKLHLDRAFELNLPLNLVLHNSNRLRQAIRYFLVYFLLDFSQKSFNFLFSCQINCFKHHPLIPTHENKQMNCQSSSRLNSGHERAHDGFK